MEYSGGKETIEDINPILRYIFHFIFIFSLLELYNMMKRHEKCWHSGKGNKYSFMLKDNHQELVMPVNKEMMNETLLKVMTTV